MMNLGDIWGASDKQKLEPVSVAPDRAWIDTKEAMLMIHHKIVALHDAFDDEDTMVDNEGLRLTTGLFPNAWQAIIDLNVSFFHERPIATARVYAVADVLLKTTHEDWVRISGAQGKLIPADIEDALE